MKVKFINIGRENISFTRQHKGELSYKWLLKQVRPYLLSRNIDFEENTKGTITVFAGMRTVGEIKVEEEEE